MNTNHHNNTLAFQLAKVLVGAGIIGAVLYFTVIPFADLLTWAALVLLPLVAVGFAIGLVSDGTYRLIKEAAAEEKFAERVKQYVSELREGPGADTHPHVL
jgi:hypothetical protein